MSIGLGNGWVPNTQAIAWPSADPDPWHHMASAGLNNLKHQLHQEPEKLNTIYDISTYEAP